MAASIPFKKPDRDIRPSPPEERALGYTSTPRPTLRVDLNESCGHFFESAPRKRNARRRPPALISKLNQSILPELPPLCPEYCIWRTRQLRRMCPPICYVHSQNRHTHFLFCGLFFPSMRLAFVNMPANSHTHSRIPRISQNLRQRPSRPCALGSYIFRPIKQINICLTSSRFSDTFHPRFAKSV
jgi:hypothetical protein